MYEEKERIEKNSKVKKHSGEDCFEQLDVLIKDIYDTNMKRKEELFKKYKKEREND